MRLRGRGNTRRALKARLEAKPSTFVTKVRKTPDLLQEQSVRAAPHWSSTSKVGKSASRQVGLRQRSSATILPRLPRRRYQLLVASGDVDNQRAECRKFGSASVIG